MSLPDPEIHPPVGGINGLSYRVTVLGRSHINSRVRFIQIFGKLTGNDQVTIFDAATELLMMAEEDCKMAHVEGLTIQIEPRKPTTAPATQP